jgi:hypothetical protein
MAPRGTQIAWVVWTGRLYWRRMRRRIQGGLLMLAAKWMPTLVPAMMGDDSGPRSWREILHGALFLEMPLSFRIAIARELVAHYPPTGPHPGRLRESLRAAGAEGKQNPGRSGRLPEQRLNTGR